VLYFANPIGQARDLMTAGILGMIATPSQGNRIPDGATWCADNGCGPGAGGVKQGTGYPGDAKWLAWLSKRTPEQIARCAFAVAPDVVGDAKATLERSAPWLPVIRDLGYPAALVAQDGLEALDVPWDAFDVLFIGGTTAWKLGPAARQLVADAKTKGKRVHMGRVNSQRRFRYAQAIGCDSVDGTKLAFGHDANLPHVIAWTQSVNQHSFDLGVFT
jgi:hypothetical protein